MDILGYQIKEEIRELVRLEIAASIVPQTEQAPPVPADIVNQRGICERFDLSEPTVIRWRNKGKIPFMRIGSAIRYDVNAVAQALSAKPNKKGASR